MSKLFRPWKIDQPQLLPPCVQDYVPEDHLSRFIVALITESLDLGEIMSSYTSGLGQPPFDPRMMTALLLNGYASGIYSSRRHRHCPQSRFRAPSPARLGAIRGSGSRARRRA